MVSKHSVMKGLMAKAGCAEFAVDAKTKRLLFKWQDDYWPRWSGFVGFCDVHTKLGLQQLAYDVVPCITFTGQLHADDYSNVLDYFLGLSAKGNCIVLVSYAYEDADLAVRTLVEADTTFEMLAIDVDFSA